MSEIHGAVGSYVVHALDDDELHEFEAHLASCETCQREVVEFSETTAQLSTLVETAPPPALRASIMSAIAQVRPLPPEVGQDSPAEVAQPVVVRPKAEATQTTPVIDELALRRNRRSTRILAFAVAAAMVVALALGGWAVNLRQEQQAQVAETALETQLLSAPDVKIYPKTLKNGTKVSFAVSKSLDKALFIGANLPPAGDGKTYQLWTQNSAGLAPNVTVAGGKETKAWLTGSMADVAGLAVSVERSGGATVPSDDIQAVVRT